MAPSEGSGLTRSWRREFLHRNRDHPKKPRRRSGRKTARPDVQLGHFRRGVKAMHSHYTGTQVDVKVLRPEQQGLRAVGHFNFFHAKTGPRGWALSLPWLGLAPA